MFNDCSFVGRTLSPRDRDIIREMNDTVFLSISWGLVVLVILSEVQKVEYSILFTDLAPPALHRLHTVIPDFRPQSVPESGEAALRKLLASRFI